MLKYVLLARYNIKFTVLFNLRNNDEYLHRPRRESCSLQRFRGVCIQRNSALLWHYCYTTYYKVDLMPWNPSLKEQKGHIIEKHYRCSVHVSVPTSCKAELQLGFTPDLTQTIWIPFSSHRGKTALLVAAEGTLCSDKQGNLRTLQGRAACRENNGERLSLSPRSWSETRQNNVLNDKWTRRKNEVAKRTDNEIPIFLDIRKKIWFWEN